MAESSIRGSSFGDGSKTEIDMSGSGYSPLIHILAVLLTVAVFPLIWVGGLVTTYDAGMAVPDWPGTYGWNMFAYPASTWLFGPFDLLVEHSHRLLGTVAGFLSIGLVFATTRSEHRTWFRWWCRFVLLAVIAQGALGGARVLLDQRTFAMIHGCTGPLFFAIATATAVMSSRWWRQDHRVSDSKFEKSGFGGDEVSRKGRTSKSTVWMAVLVLVASYVQLIAGAQLRHVTGLVSHRVFTGLVHAHLAMAGVVAVLALLLAAFSYLSRSTPVKVRRIALLLAMAVGVQLTLGIATWIVNYALPWSEVNDTLAAYTINAKGFWESLIVTAHMATGSLIVSLATVVSLRAWRSRKLGADKVNWQWKQQLA